MSTFRYEALPWNVVSGAGAVRDVRRHLEALGLRRALVISTAGKADAGRRIVALLGDLAVGLFDDAAPHVPSAVVERASELARSRNADCSVSIGGGSTTGLGKALALRHGLPIVAIPTTYAGSEMTNIWGITEDGVKVTGRSRSVVPVMTIYDPELTLSMPPALTASSGLNALAQAVATVLSTRPNPFTTALALEAIRALFRGLPELLREPQNLALRTCVQNGASLAGAALGTGATGLHHRLCHVLGGTFGAPHAETHAILLPHTLAHDAPGATAGIERLREAMGVDDPAQAMFALGRRLGAPAALSEIGLRDIDLERIATLTLKTAIDAPVPVTSEGLRRVLVAALAGNAPPRAPAQPP